MKLKSIIIVISMTMALCSCGAEVKNELEKVNNSFYTGFIPKDTTWKSLSLREKIGQTMLMLPDRKLELKLGDGSLEQYFSKYPVSGYFMGWKLFERVPQSERATFLRKSVEEYQAASRIPLIFQEDYEKGVTLEGMTPFPHAMALGATNSPELAYRYGNSVGLECRSLGVNWVLHPVADINMNPLNPVTNIRAISDNPELTIRLLVQQIRGLQESGVAATIKHFPGDGVDSRDQHLMTTCNSLSQEEWEENHGKVFRELINQGVASVMPGHITLPWYQNEKINGHYPPATLSHELLTDLLKGEMNFGGVIVSDAMTMAGFRGWYESNIEGEIQSFLAGVDMMLWPSYEYMDTLESRILRGEIPMARLDDAVSRVWGMKERFGLLSPHRELIRALTQEEKVNILETSKAVSEASITLVRDIDKKIPLSIENDKNIMLVAVTPESRKGGDNDYTQLLNLKQEFSNAGFNVDFRRNILYEEQGWFDNSDKIYDKIIILVARSPHHPFGPLQLWDDEAQTVWAANAMDKSKIIVVSLGSPYIGAEYFERVTTYINAYSNNTETHKALVNTLTGKLPFLGISPVNLERKSSL
jgi:beta-N-acetylhexosaminidase